jgi:hypothetical protein
VRTATLPASLSKAYLFLPLVTELPNKSIELLGSVPAPLLYPVCPGVCLGLDLYFRPLGAVIASGVGKELPLFFWPLAF